MIYSIFIKTDHKYEFLMQIMNEIRNMAIMCLITLSAAQGAATFTFQQALETFHKSKVDLPQPEKDGRTQTLNRKGAAAPGFDYTTKKFLAFASGKSVLEIGGAYGNVMLEALKQNPKTIYHLNDLDQRHLCIAAFRLQSKIETKEICLDGIENVNFIYGDITQPSWSTGQYDAVLMSRVIHFLTPQQIEQTLTNLCNSLKPKGRIYITALTPYVNRYKPFIAEYERRVKEGKPYPGFVDSLRKYLNKDAATPSQIEKISDGHFTFLDVTVLSRVATAAGFKVLECSFQPLSYKSGSWVLDGRENVILIAEKP